MMPRSSPPSHAPPAASSPSFDFGSHPTDVDLVNSILRPWVERGVRPPGTYAHAADLYAAEPSDLARRFRAAVDRNGERAWYFLSPLRAKSPRGRRKARTVAGGAGWWHGEAGPKPVVDNLEGRRKVGYRQSFSFMRKGGDGAPVRTGWIMVELRLHYDDDEDGGGGGIGEQLEGLVLCKVYRSPRHPDTAAAEESCAATAPDGWHSSSAVVVDDDRSSDALVVSDDETSIGAAAPTTPGPEEKTAAAGAKNEISGATTPAAARAEEEEKKAAGDKNYAAIMAVAHGREEEKKAAGDENENSAATMAVARGREEEKKAADDVDSSASTPATRKRVRIADDEGPAGAASARKKMVAAGAPATQQHLHCPQCGFHLGALQAVVSPTKSTSETETKTETGIGPADVPPRGAGTGGASGSGKDRSFHRFI
ncbi:hypothetical protein HU200_027927 [Digitaria exilis]|uniref:NAC domain-containing protein n=1 Tax=Digitaria exilis TaxID=1010633 RepID=A0A835BT24_9POAL|nr:hypothetical protein HU200_027927 [Digitaria exilis]